MSSLAQCKGLGERFVRSSLPSIRQIAPELPTLPRFRAALSSNSKRYRFLKETQPNWWQLPRDFRQSLFGSSEGQALAASLERVPPFSYSLGKRIVFPELGGGSVYDSGIDLARVILVSYLLEADARRWKPAVFNQVWNDCVSYFDPAVRTVEYFLYAPIAYMPGVARRLDLGDGLVIRRLPAEEMAMLLALAAALLIPASGDSPLCSNSTVSAATDYFLPWPGCERFIVSQGVKEGPSHWPGTSMEYAIDFDLPEEWPVAAVRGGTARHVEGRQTECGGWEFRNKANYVVIDHGDGTSALYSSPKECGSVPRRYSAAGADHW